MDIQAQLDKLTEDLKALNDEVYSNNFTGHQDFNKYVNFTSRLKIPHYDILPATCEVGELIENSGKLKICSIRNTWTTVGSQS